MNENNNYQQNPYDQNQQNMAQQQYVNPQYPQYNQYPQDTEKNNYGIASLILGIVSFFCCGTVCSIVGLILGIISKKQKPNNNGIAVAGIVLSIVSLVLSIIAVIYISVAFDSFADMTRYYSYYYSF